MSPKLVSLQQINDALKEQLEAPALDISTRGAVAALVHVTELLLAAFGDVHFSIEDNISDRLTLLIASTTARLWALQQVSRELEQSTVAHLSAPTNVTQDNAPTPRPDRSSSADGEATVTDSQRRATQDNA